MSKLFLDIETIPADQKLRPTIREFWERHQVKKARSISDEEFELYLAGTSLIGEWGRIFCIGVAIDDGMISVLQGEEPKVLKDFWQLVTTGTRFIGHGIFDFDLPFILKRSIIHRIKPTRSISFVRYRNDPIFDTMYEWSRWNTQNKSGLDLLATCLGIPTSKNGMSGHQVAEVWKKGELDRIYDYCKLDVEVTREVFRRLELFT